MFDSWCKREGVIMPALQYPAYFEGDLVGMKCIKDIDHHESYLYIPAKMILSISKAHAHPVLAPIIKANPECFTSEGIEDWEQLTLVCFIFYELTLGEKSYWLPYLRLMPDVEFITAWSQEELMALEHDEIIVEVQGLDNDIDTAWK